MSQEENQERLSEQFREIGNSMSNNKGYGWAGASTYKRALRGFKAISTSPVEDIDNNNMTLRQRGRLMFMGSPIATSAIKTNRTNTIGLGLKVNPRPDAEALGLTTEEAAEWTKTVKREFGIWANRKDACDAIGINNFYEIQQMLFMSWLTSGDVFALIEHSERTFLNPYSLRIKSIEADRCATETAGYLASTTGKNPDNGNTIYDGVETDKTGKPVAYWFRNSHPFESNVIPTEWVRVEAYGKKTGLPNVIHIVNTERPDQYRGVSYLAPVVESVLQISRYSNAEVMAAVIEAMHTGFVKTTEDPSEMPFSETGPFGEDESENRYDPNDYHLGAGEINVMNPGESIEFPIATRPNSNFEGFVKAIASQIGAALEIPRDILLKEFSTSYSASRGALLEAWKSFKMYRTWFINDFCDPIYEIWLSEAIALGRINAPGFFNDRAKREAWLGTQWIGPSQGQLDPTKEISAEIQACQNGFSTYADSALRINGSDFDSNVDTLIKESARLKEVEKVNEEIPQDTTTNEEKDRIEVIEVVSTVRDKEDE